MKKYLISSDIKEMQTKNTVRYHYMLTRIVKSQNIGHSKYFQACGATQNSCSADGNVKWCSHFGKQVGSFLKS